MKISKIFKSESWFKLLQELGIQNQEVSDDIDIIWNKLSLPNESPCSVVVKKEKHNFL